MDPTTVNVIRASKVMDSDFVTRHVLSIASMDGVLATLTMSVTVILAGQAMIAALIVDVTIIVHAQ